MADTKSQREADFDRAFKEFITTDDLVVHRRAVEEILKNVSLKSRYQKALKIGVDKVRNLFISFKDVAEEDWVHKDERESMRKVGRLARQCFKTSDYPRFANLAFSLVLQNIVDFLSLPVKKNFNQLTIDDLYQKRLLPGGIFLQFFVLETLSKPEVYNWNRCQTIIDQSLVCLGVCFTSIYDFLNCC